MDFPSIQIAGENALIIYFASVVSEPTSSQIKVAERQLRKELHAELIDVIPSYASMLVIYDQMKTDHHHIRQKLRAILTQLQGDDSQQGKLIELPAYYAEESGEDLTNLAKKAALSTDEVIQIHSAIEYRVYAIGFAPGFAYLGEVDERIAAPRLTTPRQKVPKGAVAIADKQTAVYPSESPGGWNLIGRCPVQMFDPNAEKTMPVEVGDRVKFVAIDRAEFMRLGGIL